MYYTSYPSPLGTLLLAADAEGLTGLWFAQQKYHAATLAEDATKQETPILKTTQAWLDRYFANFSTTRHGTDPGPLPPLHFIGTDFQIKVWRLLATIPYGHTTTYGAIAKRLAPTKRISAQAVGTAVGKNPISIIVPCHRVLNSAGQLSGYAAGLAIKTALLDLEGCAFRPATPNPKNML